METEPLPPVTVSLRAHWSSGSSSMNVLVRFFAPDLDEALRLIKRATDAAPIFNNPLEEGQ